MEIVDVVRSVMDAVFPGRCLLCGTWLLGTGKPGAPVCGACMSRLKPLGGRRCKTCGIPLMVETDTCTRCRSAAFAFDRNVSLFAYTGGIRDLIREYKFSDRRRLARVFAGLIAPAMRAEYPRTVVVPVPPRPGAGRMDHLGAIARLLRRDHGFNVMDVLVRSGGASQKTLDLEERRRNLLGKIHARTGRPFPRSVVLLDDIFTTGATVDDCSKALRDAGSADVGVFTLAMEE
jgi:competence protein ComFC